jgi:hypothetical protein
MATRSGPRAEPITFPIVLYTDGAETRKDPWIGTLWRAFVDQARQAALGPVRDAVDRARAAATAPPWPARAKRSTRRSRGGSRTSGRAPPRREGATAPPPVDADCEEWRKAKERFATARDLVAFGVVRALEALERRVGDAASLAMLEARLLAKDEQKRYGTTLKTPEQKWVLEKAAEREALNRLMGDLVSARIEVQILDQRYQRAVERRQREEQRMAAPSPGAQAFDPEEERLAEAERRAALARFEQRLGHGPEGASGLREPARLTPARLRRRGPGEGARRLPDDDRRADGKVRAPGPAAGRAGPGPGRVAGAAMAALNWQEALAKHEEARAAEAQQGIVANLVLYARSRSA